MQLVDLVSNYLQEELKMPSWPKDHRFYDLSFRFTFERTGDQKINVSDRRSKTNFLITCFYEKILVDVLIPHGDPLETDEPYVTCNSSEFQCVTYSDGRTLYHLASLDIDMRDPDAFKQLFEIMNNPVCAIPKIKHGS